MLTGSTTSMPTVVTSMMLAVSASQLEYCCANKTDGVPIGMLLATNAARPMGVETPITRSTAKKRAGLSINENSDPVITVFGAFFTG